MTARLPSYLLSVDWLTPEKYKRHVEHHFAMKIGVAHIVAGDRAHEHLLKNALTHIDVLLGPGTRDYRRDNRFYSVEDLKHKFLVMMVTAKRLQLKEDEHYGYAQRRVQEEVVSVVLYLSVRGTRNLILLGDLGTDDVVDGASTTGALLSMFPYVYKIFVEAEVDSDAARALRARYVDDLGYRPVPFAESLAVIFAMWREHLLLRKSWFPSVFFRDPVLEALYERARAIEFSPEA